MTASISKIDSRENLDNDEINVYVTYQYDGELYSNINLNEYTAGMHEGEEIILYCNPNNPTAICTKSGGYLAAIILILVGGLMGGILLRVYIKRRRNPEPYVILEKEELVQNHEEAPKDYRVPIGIGVFLVLIIGMIMQNDRIVGIGTVCISVFTFWAIMYHTINEKKRRKKRCTELIMAKCIGIQTHHDSDGNTYAPIYQIQYKREALTLQSDIYMSPCGIKVNQIREIKIDPKDPYVFIEPKRRFLSTPVLIVIAVFLIIWFYSSYNI